MINIEDRKEYTAFTQKYQPSEFISLTNLELIPLKRFKLTDISDLADNADKLLYLKRLILCDNCLSKLSLFNFISLKIIDASRNLITNCSLSLPKLAILNLSRNMLNSFPKLTKLPMLSELYLSGNSIKVMKADFIEPVRKTLKILDISYNKIEFKAVDFINFIESLKLFYLKSFAIEGNEFLERNNSLRKNYKMFIIASLRLVQSFNHEMVTIDKNNISEDEIKAQMFIEDKETDNTSNDYNETMSTVTEFYRHYSLKTVEEIQNRNDLTNNLLYLDLSNNMIEKLDLHDFVKLIDVKVSYNFIKEASISNCEQLQKIYLSYNMMANFPKLDNTPNVELIHLDNNQLQYISLAHILSCTLLNTLYLRENQIKTVVDMENFHTFLFLTRIFIDEDSKKAILSFLYHNQSDYNPEMTINDILTSVLLLSYKENSIKESLISLNYQQLKERHKSQQNTISESLMEINKILEMIIKKNGNHQMLYISFLTKVNHLLGKICDMNLEQKDEEMLLYEEPNLKDIFNEFLMQCNELMNIKAIYTNALLKIIIQFALLTNNVLSDMIFIYLKTLVNTEKNNELQDAFQTIIDYPEENFDILRRLINFMNKNENLKESILKHFILKLIGQVGLYDFSNFELLVIDEKMKITFELLTMYFVIQSKIFERDQIKGKKFSYKLDKLGFLSKFKGSIVSSQKSEIKENDIQSQESSDKEKKSAARSTYKGTSAMSAFHYRKKTRKKKKKEKDLELDGYNSGELSDTIEPSKISANELLNRQYGLNLAKFIGEEQKMTFLSVIQSACYEIETKKDDNYLKASRCVKKASMFKYWLYVGAGGEESKNKDSFFKNELLKLLNEEDTFLHFHKMKNEYKQFKDLIYAFIFIRTFYICYQILLFLNKFEFKKILQKDKEKTPEIRYKTTINNMKTFLIPNKLKDNPVEKEMRRTEEMKKKFKFYLSIIDLFDIVCNTQRKCVYTFKKNLLRVNFSGLLNEIEYFFERFIPELNSNRGNLIDLTNEENLAFNDFKQRIMSLYGCILMEETSNLYSILHSNIINQVLELFNYESIEPYLLLGCCDIINKLLLNEDIRNDNKLLAKIVESANLLKNLLTYIDESHHKFKNLVETVFKDNNLELTVECYDFTHLSNPLIIKIFIKILNIFETLLKINPQQNTYKYIQTILDDLRRYNSQEIILKTLLISDDKIKILAMNCFYYFKHNTITNDNMAQIIRIINKYSSSIEGKNNIILTKIYVTLNNKLYNMLRNTFYKNIAPIQTAVKCAVQFLNINSGYLPTTPRDAMNKNLLNCILLLFLTTASCSSNLYDLVKSELGDSIQSIFSNILYNDYKYIKEGLYYPLEIERTYLGNYVSLLLDTIGEVNCVPPYSYPFLRILIKTADLLCNIPDCTMETNYNRNIVGLFKSLSSEEIEQRKIFKITNELKKWYDVDIQIDEMLKEVKAKRKKKIISWFKNTTEHINFKYQSNSPKKNSEYLETFIHRIKKYLKLFYKDKLEKLERDNNNSGKAEENQHHRIYLPSLKTKELIAEQFIFVSLFPALFIHLFGTSSKIKDESINSHLKEKFDKQLVKSHEILDSYEYFEKISQITTVFGSVKNSNIEIPFTKPYSLFNYQKLKKSLKDDLKGDICNSMKISSLYSISKMNQAKGYNPPNQFLDDLQKYSLEGLVQDSQRIVKEETVDNPHLRSLIIASFLRCCYSIMISPSKDIKNDFVKTIFMGNKIKDMLLFVDTSLYEYNTMNKIVILLEKIYSIENLGIIIDALTYKLKEDIEREKNKSKPLLFQSEFFMSDCNAKNDKLVFHNLYIITLFLEKLIYNYVTFYYRKKEENDFIFCTSLFNCLSNFFVCISQIALKSIHPIFFEAAIINKFCSKEILQLVLDMLDQYDNYVMYAFFNIEFFIDLYAKLKGEGYYHEKMKSFFNETIDEILRMIYIENINKLKFYQFITYISKFDMTFVEKITEKLTKDISNDNDQFNDKMLFFFKTQKITNITISLKTGQNSSLYSEDENIFFSDICEINFLNGIKSNNVFIVLTQKQLIAYEMIEENRKIKRQNPLLRIPLSDIIQILVYDYANQIFITLRNETSFTVFFSESYLTKSFIEILFGLNQKIFIKENKMLTNIIEQKEDYYRSLIIGKLNRCLYNINQDENQKRELNRKFALVKTIKEALLEKIVITTVFEDNFYKNLTYPQSSSNCLFAYVDGIQRIIVIGEFALYTFIERIDLIKELIRGLEGYEIPNTIEFMVIDKEIQLNTIETIEEDYNSNSLEIVYKKMVEKRQINIRFVSKDDLRLCRALLLGLNKNYFEKRDYEKSLRSPRSIHSNDSSDDEDDIEYDDIVYYESD